MPFPRMSLSLFLKGLCVGSWRVHERDVASVLGRPQVFPTLVQSPNSGRQLKRHALHSSSPFRRGRAQIAWAIQSGHSRSKPNDDSLVNCAFLTEPAQKLFTQAVTRLHTCKTRANRASVCLVGMPELGPDVWNPTQVVGCNPMGPLEEVTQRPKFARVVARIPTQRVKCGRMEGGEQGDPLVPLLFSLAIHGPERGVERTEARGTPPRLFGRRVLLIRRPRQNPHRSCSRRRRLDCTHARPERIVHPCVLLECLSWDPTCGIQHKLWDAIPSVPDLQAASQILIQYAHLPDVAPIVISRLRPTT